MEKWVLQKFVGMRRNPDGLLRQKDSLGGAGCPYKLAAVGLWVLLPLVACRLSCALLCALVADAE